MALLLVLLPRPAALDITYLGVYIINCSFFAIIVVSLHGLTVTVVLLIIVLILWSNLLVEIALSLHVLAVDSLLADHHAHPGDDFADGDRVIAICIGC